MGFKDLAFNLRRYYYYNGLILPLHPVLCRFKRDLYSLSRGSQDISVLLSLFQFLFIFISFPSSFLILLLSSFTTVVAKYCYTVNFCSWVNLVLISVDIFFISIFLFYFIFFSI